MNAFKWFTDEVPSVVDGLPAEHRIGVIVGCWRLSQLINCG